MLHVLPAQFKNCQAISSIYNYYVETSTATFALENETLGERELWFREHFEAALPVIVAELEGSIIGFASLSFYHQRCGYKKTVEASIYIDHNFLQRGFGRALMQELMTAAAGCGYHAVLGLICSENLGSVKLMRQFGFEDVGCLREVGNKFDRWLDVQLLQRIL